MRSRIFITTLICVVVCLAIGTAKSSPIVFAHYMPGYALSDQYATGTNAVSVAVVTNVAAWPPSLADTNEWFAPSLVSQEGGAASMPAEITIAQSAGVNAFGFLLSEGSLSDATISNVFTNMVDADSAIKIIPEIWDNPWTDNYAAYGINLHTYMAGHPGDFETVGGKPVIAFEIPNTTATYGLAEQTIALDQIKAFCASWGGLGAVYSIAYVPYQVSYAEGSPISAAVNCIDVWAPTDDWSALDSPTAYITADALGKDLAWPVSPAFYQRRARALPDGYGNSMGAARFIDAWMAAIARKPTFVDIQTWNDFSEDSAVVPTNMAGSCWADLASYFTTWLATGSAPAITTEKVFVFHQRQLVGAKLSNPAAVVTSASWDHATPTCDYVDAVTELKSSATVTITVGRGSWTTTAPAGLYDFLVYSPNSAVPGIAVTAKSCPVTSSYRLAKGTTEFNAAVPTVTISRNGSIVGTVTSKMALQSTGAYQDLTVIGDEASW